jgi:hypothetical protein
MTLILSRNNSEGVPTEHTEHTEIEAGRNFSMAAHRNRTTEVWVAGRAWSSTPFFVSGPPTQPILRIVFGLNVSLSATAKGRSKTLPYLGICRSPWLTSVQSIRWEFRSVCPQSALFREISGQSSGSSDSVECKARFLFARFVCRDFLSGPRRLDFNRAVCGEQHRAEFGGRSRQLSESPAVALDRATGSVGRW